MLRGKVYFALYLLKVIITSFLYKLKFKVFGARVGKKVKFAGNMEICGYINNISIGNKCYIDKKVAMIINKEGKIIIDNNTLISYNTIINAGKGKICIGKNSMIAANTYIINNDHDISDRLSVRDSAHITKDVHIGDNVWIGANCVILKGVTIGEGSVIGAGSVVTKSIPPYSVAVGNPCKKIKGRYN